MVSSEQETQQLSQLEDQLQCLAGMGKPESPNTTSVYSLHEHVTLVRSHSKVEQRVCNVWKDSVLLLVCVLLPWALLLILDCCRPVTADWQVPLWDWQSLLAVLGFTGLQVALYYMPLGKVAEGKVGFHGKCIKYNMNGVYALTVTVMLLAALWHCGVFRACVMVENVPQLVIACVFLSLVFSTWLYLQSQSAHPQQLLTCTQHSNILQQFALGRLADPALGRMDLKQFFMVRIGFIGWALVDICYLLAEVETRGSPSLSLLLSVTFQLIYILDFLIDEESVLPTKEYIEDGIGFLMILGEYIWIPFFSSVPVYFLLQRPTHLSLLSALLSCVLFGSGFFIYFCSNAQKNGFRTNPNSIAYAHLQTIPSPSGRRLLVSGWFGWVRHPNYLGDMMVTLAWCLPCGLSSLLPFLPALQCVNLLRQRVDEQEERCKRTHTQAWTQYCRRVPYKLIPHLY